MAGFDNNPESFDLFSRLAAHGMAEETARALVLAHDPELVGWALSELERRIKANVETANPAGWLHDAIVNDYRPQQTPFDKAQEEAREKQRKREARRGELEANILNIQRAYGVYEKMAIMQYVELLEDVGRGSLED